MWCFKVFSSSLWIFFWSFIQGFVLFVCSFHLDHAASLPYFLEKVFSLIEFCVITLLFLLVYWKLILRLLFLDHIQRSCLHDLRNKGYLQVAFNRLCKSEQGFSWRYVVWRTGHKSVHGQNWGVLFSLDFIMLNS